MAYQIQGRRVSRDWHAVLAWAERDGVSFTLNSGQRTFAEQQRLVAQLGVWSPSNRTGAAVPSHSAPHIRTGRQDHALDVRWDDGGRARIQAWLRAHGVETALTVPGEPWHIEATSAAALARAAREARRPRTVLDRLRVAPLRQGAKSRDVRAVQVYLRRGGYLPASFEVASRVGTYGPAAVAAVRSFQRHVGLTADGVVGPKTFAALRRRWGWKRWLRILDRRGQR